METIGYCRNPITIKINDTKNVRLIFFYNIIVNVRNRSHATENDSEDFTDSMR